MQTSRLSVTHSLVFPPTKHTFCCLTCHTTCAHQVIRNWAEKHNSKPDTGSAPSMQPSNICCETHKCHSPSFPKCSRLCKTVIPSLLKFKRYEDTVMSVSKLTFFKRSFRRNVFLAIMLESFGRIKTPNALNCI